MTARDSFSLNEPVIMLPQGEFDLDWGPCWRLVQELRQVAMSVRASKKHVVLIMLDSPL